MVTKEPKVEIDTRPPYKNEAKKTTSAIIDIMQPLKKLFLFGQGRRVFKKRQVIK